MSYFTPDFDHAYHDHCCPEAIRHHTWHPPITHVGLNNRTLPGYWIQAPGWHWASWRAGVDCDHCHQPC